MARLPADDPDALDSVIPGLLEAWGRHPALRKRLLAMGATLLDGSLPARDREIVILRTARRYDSDYEYGQHRRLALDLGMTEAEIDAVVAPAPTAHLDAFDATLVRAADELHDAGRLSTTTRATLAERYDDEQLLEVAVLAGFYHAVAATIAVGEVALEPDLEPLPTRAEAPARGRLAGRSVVVVGAGTAPSGMPDDPVGNGRAIAVLCGREGATVTCVDVDEVGAEETAGLVRAEGATADVVVADVADAERCQALVDAVPSVDGLVLNVGIGLGRGLEGTSVEDWDTTFAVNLRAHFLIARAALARMEGTGSIVFVSSVAGVVPGSRIPAYDASKAGLLGLCRNVALEGAPRGVRANAVLPGLIDTPLGRRATQGRPSRGRTPVPLGRHGTAWEVAQACVFLLSDQASYVTGQRLVVDGGLTMGA